MMCVRGYSSDVADAIHLDEKLEAASKLPPNIGQFKKSFTGMCDFYKAFFYSSFLRNLVLHIYFWNNWFT